ncbi:hypothetical protein GYA19_02785 [Candidatus Beckwithbacteria bacterium]|nr:hypothetical protein [Candidatus Beckwithbacteria bacterium]
MKKHFHNLFIPHHHNNHKAKLLHHQSLSKLILFLLFIQLALSFILQVRPGILGYASNITVSDIYNLTNQQREKENLADLTFNNSLAQSAQQKALHMFANNYWAHNAPDGTSPWYFFKNVNYNYLYAGENLARDFGDSVSTVQAWMDSPTHRDNIMSGNYTEIGIAVVNGILNGQETTLVVQHFGKPTVNAAYLPEAVKTEEITPKTEEVKEEKQQEITTEPEIAQQEILPATEQKIENQNEKVEYQILTKDNTLPEQNLEEQILSQINKFPVFSTFDITKSINLALSFIIIFVLILDGFLIWHKGITRKSGKNFVHLALFVLVALLIILTRSGKVT